MAELRKYTLEELKIGMIVRTDQLDNIYDVYILIKNPVGESFGDGMYALKGEITFIGDIESPDYPEAWNNSLVDNKSPAVFYQNSDNSLGVYYAKQ